MQNRSLQDARILVIDDELSNIQVLEQMLEQRGWSNIASTTNPRESLELCQSLQPDLILLDLMMPEMNGFEVMEQLQGKLPPDKHPAIIVLTADISVQTKRQALIAGANDFLTKPFDAVGLFLRISNVLQMRFLHLQLKEQNVTLEDKVRERTRGLEDAHCEILKNSKKLQLAQLETLDRLAQAAEWRDDDTGEHTRRVGRLAALLAEEIGLESSTVELIRRAAPLHDVGKIGVPDSILLKPSKLTNEEFESMKAHTTIGASMLANGEFELILMAERIAISHHERWAGGGYPHKLQGEAIPIEGRIVAVADVFDALTHSRPYKRAWPVEQAIEEITSQAGNQFDPQLVQAFLKLYHPGLI